ncbi:Ankyrin repeat, SAM and basic leucine zipper domain-containing protein 1 [Toxocara canis]|uniref:Ankyrin repeat, SAM and basic leucine zipper domain-containing protein 1 n=1 Tax=Toxocara canis TaxID=6265 RepID=A0A0B2V151_TOXCA|nr:Ankyrin repeat, SAM and basic leucine zipper domain-containing protein 1 [Toxocara canis]
MDGYLQAQMDFLEACSAGDINKTMLLLGSGRVDINFHHRINGCAILCCFHMLVWRENRAHDENSRTGLHWAARRGHADIVNLLLRTGFDPISQAKDGRTPIDVATEPSIKTILEKYSLSPSTESSSDTVVQLNSSSSDSLMREANNNGLEKGDAYSPPRDADDKGSISSKKSPTDSLDLTASPPPPTSPTTPTRKQELYSYGRRDSLDRTRFLLVRTRDFPEKKTPELGSLSCGNGKEAFRRITLPGGGSVEFMKLTIERAMKMGTVMQVATLPDGVPIEKDEQIRDLADCQKVEVTFGSDSSEEKHTDRQRWIASECK